MNNNMNNNSAKQKGLYLEWLKCFANFSKMYEDIYDVYIFNRY